MANAKAKSEMAAVAARGAAKAAAMDWTALLPVFMAIIAQLLELFKKKQQQLAASAHCPADEEHRACLAAQQKALIEALVHNAHMLHCCEPEPAPEPNPEPARS